MASARQVLSVEKNRQIMRSFFWVGFQGEERITTIQNVFGVIEGTEEPDRYVKKLLKE